MRDDTCHESILLADDHPSSIGLIIYLKKKQKWMATLVKNLFNIKKQSHHAYE
jgi:hypothetical protein